MFRELDGVKKVVARFIPPQLIRTKIGAVPHGTTQTEADPPRNTSEACSPGGDKETFIENAWVRVFRGTYHPSVRLECKTSQATPREKQPSKNNGSKRKTRRRNRKLRPKNSI